MPSLPSAMIADLRPSRCRAEGPPRSVRKWYQLRRPRCCCCAFVLGDDTPRINRFLPFSAAAAPVAAPRTAVQVQQAAQAPRRHCVPQEERGRRRGNDHRIPQSPTTSRCSNSFQIEDITAPCVHAADCWLGPDEPFLHHIRAAVACHREVADLRLLLVSDYCGDRKPASAGQRERRTQPTPYSTRQQM